MSSQLVLDLPDAERTGRADFLPGACNADALSAIDRWRAWPGGALLVVGPEGSGRSHLLRIWAEEAGASRPPVACLPEALPALVAEPGPVAVDDADNLAGDAAGQEALFHLINHQRSAGQPLLLTARTTPGPWDLSLADLESRLQTLEIARLRRPDDDLLLMVLAKLADDRQLALPPAVLSYLAVRTDRSLRHAARVIDALDTLALTRQRRVTRALAAEALASLDSGDGAE